MKSKTSVPIAISIEMPKIPPQVQYLELRPLLEVEISLLSHFPVKHEFFWFPPVSKESNISQHFPFSPTEQTLGAAEALTEPFLSHQLCWAHLEATGRQIHGGATPTSTPERAAPAQWKAQRCSPAGLLSFSGHSRRTLQFDNCKSIFWVLLLD